MGRLKHTTLFDFLKIMAMLLYYNCMIDIFRKGLILNLHDLKCLNTLKNLLYLIIAVDFDRKFFRQLAHKAIKIKDFTTYFWRDIMINKQTTTGSSVVVGKQRSYGELIEFLDANWSTTHTAEETLSRMKRLDAIFDNASQKIDAILIGGINGKSLTVHFASRVLREEGLQVGAFYSPHILTYNERFCIDNEVISNKVFTELGNDVLAAAETLGFTPTSHDEETARPAINALLSNVKPGTHVVSADQSKLNLQVMLELVEARGGVWDMPIRKLIPLEYPFEQLHGRCAALAERISSIYINTFVNKGVVVVSKTLLTKLKGQRGRPTLEAKRQSELHPKRTVEQFWKEVSSSLSGRFQILDKEKPSILLDNANNIDAFKNLLLGIRLLHYRRPLKGLTLVLGCNNTTMNQNELLKLLRYFFKKTSGSVIVCPVEKIPGHSGDASWDAEQVTNDIKGMKIKARSAKNFKEAFEVAQKSVDERHGLVVIAGCSSIVTEYWRHKGIKKL